MRFILGFLIGLVVGGYAIHVYERNAAEHRGDAATLRDSVDGRIQEWHLTPDDLRADLGRTGEVVRSKAGPVVESLGDARIVSVIKARFVLDRQLSAIDIHVESNDGRVVLTGMVATPDLIGRAVALALDTGGVRSVTARLQSKS